LAHPTLSPRVRRAVTAWLAGGLLTLGASTAPAAADAQPSILVSKDTLTISPFADGTSGSEDRQTSVSLNGAGPDAHQRYTLTYDASGLEDLLATSSRSPVPCDPDGDLVGECARSDMNQVLAMDTAVKASAAGRSGTIRIVAKSGGKVVDTARITVKVAAPGLVFDRALTGVTGAEPSSTIALPGGFTNFSHRTYRSVELRVSYSDGLSPVEKFRNCTYFPTLSAGSASTQGGMSCALTGHVAPGTSYNVNLGPMTISEQAVSENLSYRVSVPGPGSADQQKPAGGRGTGRALTFTERAGDDTHVRSGPLPSSTPVRTTNQADFSVNSVTLKGRVGDVVKADFFFTNNGPGAVSAVFDSESDNDTGRVIELTVPKGVTVVEAPESCHKQVEEKRRDKHRTDRRSTGGPRYECWQARMDKSALMTPGQFERFPFSFRLDEPDRSPHNQLSGREGRIRIKTETTVDEFDRNKTNNESWIGLDIKGDPKASARSTDRGTDAWYVAGGAAALLVLACAAHARRRGNAAIGHPDGGTDAPAATDRTAATDKTAESSEAPEEPEQNQ